MTLLAIWAAINIGIWWNRRKTAQGSRLYFWQMNALWNCINLAIAGIATTAVMLNIQHYNTDESIQTLQIRILAINILADLLYIACGFTLEHYGAKRQNDRLDGYGQAITLQGAFLLCFDSVLATALLVLVI